MKCIMNTITAFGEGQFWIGTANGDLLLLCINRLDGTE